MGAREIVALALEQDNSGQDVGSAGEKSCRRAWKTRIRGTEAMCLTRNVREYGQKSYECERTDM